MATNMLKDMLLTPQGEPRKVRFVEYRGGNLWYRTETNLLFPVPIADIGEATFKAEDKATLFMRYIRRHLEVMRQAHMA